MAILGHYMGHGMDQYKGVGNKASINGASTRSIECSSRANFKGQEVMKSTTGTIKEVSGSLWDGRTLRAALLLSHCIHHSLCSCDQGENEAACSEATSIQS